MPTEFVGFFHRDPLAVALEYGWGYVIKERRGELEGPNAFQFRDFLEEVVQGRAPRIRPEFLEERAVDGGGGRRVGGRRRSLIRAH